MYLLSLAETGLDVPLHLAQQGVVETSSFLQPSDEGIVVDRGFIVDVASLTG